MLQLTMDKVTSHHPAITRFPYFTHAEELNRQEIRSVLNKAASDPAFLAQLTHRGSDALQSYHLTSEAKVALLSGDIRWIEAHVGKLDEQQQTWLRCRLQQEIW